MRRMMLALAAAWGIAMPSWGDGVKPKSFVHASWNVGHYDVGRDCRSHVKASDAEVRGKAYRDFLDNIGAATLGLCEYSSNFVESGYADARKNVFGRYGDGRIGPREDYQWNALLYNGLALVDSRIRYYPKHVQNVYYMALKLKPSDGEPIWFVQTHLDWAFSKGHEEDRADQMRTIIEDFRNEPRVVVSGDFNVVHRWVDEKGTRHMKPAPEEYQVFAKAGYTLGNADNLPTCPADSPSFPLDNIIVRGVKISEFKVWPSWDLSDHNLVSARITYE